MITCDLQAHRTAVSSSKLNLSKGNYNALRSYLDIDWNSVTGSNCENVEELWLTVKNKITEGMELYIPKVSQFSSWKKNGNSHSVKIPAQR